jgi:hypothetical protein
MSFKDDNDKPPTSKDEADARRVRPPPEKYDPDTRSHWSITMTVAWIIRRDIDAVRNERDDYRNECARQPSGWISLSLMASSEHIRPQVAIAELWKAAGEGRIKASAIEYKNAKAILGDPIEIPAHYWPYLKPVDDPLTGKAMLTDDQGRVYREVQFRQSDVKKLWPKLPPLSGEHAETWPSDLALIQLTESTMSSGPFAPPCAYSDSHRSEVDALEHVEKQPEPEQTRPAEPELLEPKARPTPESSHQSKRAERYIKKHYGDSTDGVSTPAIRRKFLRDKDLQAELEKEGGVWGVPSEAVINRVLGRRK